MTVSVSVKARDVLTEPLGPPGSRKVSRPVVLFAGQRWSIWSIHDTQKEAVTQGNNVQEGSRNFKVRVTKITPKVRGKSWAVVVKRR